MKNTNLELERFFRKYYKHCLEPDIDTLKEFLASAYSLNDKIRKESGHDFFSTPEFIALKALRNYFEHHGEIQNEMRVITSGFGNIYFQELSHACIVNTSSVYAAIDKLRKK